jgi:hypothetical protein
MVELPHCISGDLMKAICLVILTFLALYNPKVEAKSNELDLRSIEIFDEQIANVTISKETPFKNIDENTKKLATLIKIMDEVKIHNNNLFKKLLEKIENQNTFSGDELYLIKKTSEVFFKLTTKIMQMGSFYEFKNSIMSKTFAQPQMNPDLIKGHLIWLSSNIVVMDSIESAHKILYQHDGSFRRIFKLSFDTDKITDEEKSSLKAMTLQLRVLRKILESEKFLQQVILVRQIADKISLLVNTDPDAITLLNEIQTNKIANDMAQGRKDFRLVLHGYGDALISVLNKTTNYLSEFFGNVSGNIRWRKGFLYGNQAVKALAQKSLIPMDIILEKSPFVLTDKLIPGHYGHVALYLGTKEQLIAIGMWDHPQIIPYQTEIAAGKVILEAVRSGVRLNSLEEFLNIDEYTIIRKNDGLASFAQISEQITRGMDQLKKDYDFNFDISTLDKIVCSELIYIIFGHVNWPTQYRLGRPTITPDDIGEILFKKNTAFKMIEYVAASKRNKIEKYDIYHLADIYDYEYRSMDGSAIKDLASPTNSFWKKETKCYTVSSNENDGKNPSHQKKRCKTTLKEYNYEEEPGL